MWAKLPGSSIGLLVGRTSSYRAGCGFHIVPNLVLALWLVGKDSELLAEESKVYWSWCQSAGGQDCGPGFMWLLPTHWCVELVPGVSGCRALGGPEAGVSLLMGGMESRCGLLRGSMCPRVGIGLLMCWLSPDKAGYRTAVILGLVPHASWQGWVPGDTMAGACSLLGEAGSWGHYWLTGRQSHVLESLAGGTTGGKS